MFDAVAIGEILIDFTPAGGNEAGHSAFTANPGGAPANVMAALAKWGRKTAFMGKAGADQFGYFLKNTLEQSGVDARGLVLSQEYRTTLAFVHLDQEGDRSFSFYRNPGADMMLHADEVSLEVIEQSSLLHFGSVSLTDEPAASATLHAVREARRMGKLISFDPNLRLPLWRSKELAAERINEGLQYAHIVKLSEEELEFLTGTDNLEQGTRQLYEDYNLPVILVTLGAKGAFYRLGGATGLVTGNPVQPVDTTGAGDCFFAGFLFKLQESGQSLDRLDPQVMDGLLRFANASGALITLGKGAIPAIPAMEDIYQFMDANPLH